MTRRRCSSGPTPSRSTAAPRATTSPGSRTRSGGWPGGGTGPARVKCKRDRWAWWRLSLNGRPPGVEAKRHPRAVLPAIVFVSMIWGGDGQRRSRLVCPTWIAAVHFLARGLGRLRDAYAAEGNP